MTKTTHSVRNPYGPTHNANIMKTIQLQGLDKTIEEMTDEGIETMMDAFTRTLLRGNHADEPGFHDYLEEAISLMKQELTHRTIGTKPHKVWEEGRKYKRTYYD